MTEDQGREPQIVASVIVPAHNEERTIGRLLTSLVSPDLEIVVVCNGCADRTPDIAREFGVCVLELTEPSKSKAMRAGDAVATAYPRVLVDADVEVSSTDIHLLVAALRNRGALACAPARTIPREGVSRLVRWYYDIWENLPPVREGIFGRGVIALSRDGTERLRALPHSMSDDLALSESFAPYERFVASDSRVIVHPPRNAADLMRRRVRAATGIFEADEKGLRSHNARSSLSDLSYLVSKRPSLILKVVTFLAVTVAARIAARRAIMKGDYVTWHRDESSRRQ